MNPSSEEEKEPEVQPIPQAKSSLDGGLSAVSKRFDVGNKGFLDEDERIIRNYDTNNDGSLDLTELKQIVQDLRQEKKEKSTFKKLSVGSSALLVFVLVANFGLIWAVVVLTRQVEMQNGQLVDSSTNKMVTTKSEGTGLSAKLDPRWSALLESQEEEDNRRNLRSGFTPPWVHPLRRLRADHEGVRKLQEAQITLAEILNTPEQITSAFVAYTNAQSTEANLVHTNGNTYSVKLASGVFHVTDGTCGLSWRNIMEFDTTCPKYSLSCCDVTNPTANATSCRLGVYELCTE